MAQYCFLRSFSQKKKKRCRVTIEPFLLHRLFSEKGWLLWLAGVCAVILDAWGERNDRVFHGRERDYSDVWALIRFHVILWALVLKIFCKYSLGCIIIS